MDKQNLEKIAESVQNTITVLNDAKAKLEAISASLKGSIPMHPQGQAETPAPVAKAQNSKLIGDVQAAFPADLEEMLNFTEQGNYIVIKPKQFLGSENFAKIASCIRGLGGEYISAGKDSHFRINKLA